MSKVLKMLTGGGLAVLGVALLGFSGTFSAADAHAESPPNPPSRFAGSVLVDGAAPPAGTRIEARIGSSTCGVTTTQNTGGESRYVLDVPALDPGATPNCGTDGASVSFFIGDKQAAQTGSWANYKLTELNLTYTTPATATPTASTTATPSTTATATSTPKPPVTGTGAMTSSDSSSMWVFAALGLGALAFGVGGTVVARKSR